MSCSHFVRFFASIQSIKFFCESENHLLPPIGGCENTIFLTVAALYVFIVGTDHSFVPPAFASRTSILPSAFTAITIPVCPFGQMFCANIPHSIGTEDLPCLSIAATLLA